MTEIFKLIEGDFSPVNAGYILLELINKKISFHELEILSKKERSGDNCEISEKRIISLTATKNKLLHFLKEAKANKDTLKIKCNIEIEKISHSQ